MSDAPPDTPTQPGPTPRPPVTLPHNATDQEWLQAFLDHHNATCPSCKYDLKGLQSDHCPECGQALVLAVHVEQPSLAAFITTVIFLTPPAAFGLVTLFLILPNLSGADFTAIPCLVMSYFLLALPALFILLSKRQAFLRLPTAAQAWIAFFPIAIDVVLVLLLFALVN
ncbi:MAG: hypothetical protein AAF750_12500 [Planctomycetota bacterium]